MRDRALSSSAFELPAFERIGGALRAARAFAALTLLAASGCGSGLTASAQGPADADVKPDDRSGVAGEVRLYELPEGYAWNFGRRLTGLSSTLDAIKDPSLCGDGIDESWSRLRSSLDAIDEIVRAAPGGLIAPDNTSRVWIQSIEPVDRSIAAYEKQDAKQEGALTAGIASIRVGADAAVHHTKGASELLLGRQAYEVRLTDEAVACIRLNAELDGRAESSGPVWDRIVYGALEQTLVGSSAFDVKGEITAPMLRVNGGLDESQVSARVDQLGAHSAKNDSSAPDVQRLLKDQRLNELLAATNSYYDRTAIIAAHAAGRPTGDPTPALSMATGDEDEAPPETVVYFANTSDKDLDLWSGSLPKGLCVVSRGGPPIEDEAAVRAAMKRDLGRWFDTGEVKLRGGCAPIQGAKPIHYYLINALSGRSYRVDPSDISKHYHFKAIAGEAGARDAGALAMKAELSPAEKNLWLLDRLRSFGASLDARGVLPEVPDDTAGPLRAEYSDKLLEASYPSAADALRVLRSIVRLTSFGSYGAARLHRSEGEILKVLAGGASREYALKPWWPAAGDACKLQWHDANDAPESGAREGAWRLFCQGQLLGLRNIEVWSTNFPVDMAAPQSMAVSVEIRPGEDTSGRAGKSQAQGNPDVYGYILGDLLFFRRDALPQALHTLGERMSKSDPGTTYSIQPSATSGLEWIITTASAVSEIAWAEDKPLGIAPTAPRCAKHYIQGRIARLSCEAPAGFSIDQRKLGASLGLSCRGTSIVECTEAGSPSAPRWSSPALAVPLIANPPLPPPASQGGGA